MSGKSVKNLSLPSGKAAEIPKIPMTLDSEIKKWLQCRFKENVKFNEPMWRHTSFRVGGPADAWVAPANLEALMLLVSRCRDEAIPYTVVGDGTNLLVADSGIRGIVIVLKNIGSDFWAADNGDATVRVTATAGSRLQALCRFAIKQGLAGLNFALGIPGTVGGAIRMNAGTHLGSMADVLESVKILSDSGSVHTLQRQHLDFSYRNLTWNADVTRVPVKDAIILECCFRLRRKNSETLAEEAEHILKIRKSRQPWRSSSAGCFFKNPAIGKTAGELIDLAGLKGKKIGTAQVSRQHANFIVNTADPASPGSATDILSLMKLVKEKVFAQFHVNLETEVKIAGSQSDYDHKQV